MSLRFKVVTILAATIALYVGIDYGIQKLVVLPRFTDLERVEAEKDMNRCIDALRREIHHLGTITLDWAAWTDSYRFVQDRNEEFIEATLQPDAFRNAGLNLLYYLDLEGNVVWGKIRELESLNTITLPRFPEEKWPESELLDLDDPPEGVVLTSLGPMLVASRPITLNDPTGTPRGTLVMGRFLDDKVIGTLREQTKVPFSVRRFDGEDLPERFRSFRDRLVAGRERTGTVVIEEVDSDRLEGCTAFAGIDGQPALLLLAGLDREITAKGKTAIAYAWFSSLATGLLVLAVVIFLVGRTVLSRVEALSDGVAAVGNGGTPAARVGVTGQDELARLGGVINRMLERLDLSRRVLSRSAEVYRKAIESANGVPYQLRYTDGCLEFVGDGFETLFGYPAADFTIDRLAAMMKNGTTIDPAAGYDDLDDYLAAFRRGTIPRCRVDFRIESADDDRWISHVAVPVREGGRREITGALGIFQDITARKQAEKKVQMLAAGVEQSIDGVAVADLEGRILFANPAWAAMHGMKAEEMPGVHLNIFHTKEQIERDVEPFHVEVLGSGAHQGEVGHVRRDGTIFPTWMSTTLLKDRQGEPFAMLGIARDLTTRKELEKELLQAQKLKAVGRFADGVARDFDDLLGAVRRDCELILSRVGAGDLLRRDVEEIREAGERAATLTGQLLAFSRRQEIHPEVLDLNGVIDEAGPQLKELAKGGIALVLDLSPDLSPVRADRSHIEEVILNLAGNARDAMPHGGELVVRTENTDLTERECASMPGLRPGPFVRLDVADSGVGMNRAILDQIFEPFFSTKGEGEGTGLGLSTVYGIVKQHESWISVDSAPGAGTTFSLFMPAAHA